MAKRSAFMVMPFGDKVATKAYECCVVPVCKSLDLDIRRADELLTPNPVYDDIVKEINQAIVIVVDISGKNPNVFYELGIAHTLKQDRTIILTHDGPETAPFDIRHFRLFAYEDTIEGAQQLTDKLRKTIELLLEDLAALHREEFEVTYRAFKACGENSVLYILVGMSQLPGPLFADGALESGGQTEPDMLTETFGHGRAVTILGPAIGMQYAQIIGPHIQLTELGRAFAQFLLVKGVRCHMLDKHKFTKDYVSFQERANRQRQEKLSNNPRGPAGPAKS